jgi:hypothetical protein
VCYQIRALRRIQLKDKPVPNGGDMRLVQGMLLASMLMAGGAGAANKAVDAGSGMSGDDEWACKVVMCMASPGGPTQFAECVDPIRKLQRQLAKGKPFPVCRFVGSSGGQQGGNGSSTGTAGSKQERDPAQAL